MLYSYGDIEGLLLRFDKNNDNCSNAYVFKDETGEEYEYCAKCQKLIIDNIHMNCNSSNYEYELHLERNDQVIYEIDLECGATYDFSVSSQKSVEVDLYDENDNLIINGTKTQKSNGDYETYIVRNLDKGKYYLKTKLTSIYESGDIQTTIKPRNATIESLTGKTEVDVLNHLHNHQNRFSLYASESKLYRFELVGEKNETFTYPNQAITITNSQGQIVTRLPNQNQYTLQAETINHNNSLLLYAEAGENYTIHIQFDVEGMSSLKLLITPEENFVTQTTTSNDSYIETHTMSKGDNGKSIVINRIGQYSFNLYYNGTQTTDTIVSILKEDESGNYIH